MESSKVRETGELRQFISFSVGDEEYGLELLRVKEVIRVREITWLPKAPSFVKGIINLRGDVIPIIDLRDKFGLESREQTAQTRVIVVEVDGKPVGTVSPGISPGRCASTRSTTDSSDGRRGRRCVVMS